MNVTQHHTTFKKLIKTSHITRQPPCHRMHGLQFLAHCFRPEWINNTFINTTRRRVRRRTLGESSTVIAPKHQPLILLKTNWCSMLTSFTLISGIKKNTGCNMWRGGERGGLGWRQDWGNYPLMLHQTADERGGGRESEEETVQRKSQVAGVREEKERIEARRNRGIGRRKEKTSEWGDWAKLEGFSVQKVDESMRWNWWRAGAWRKQAHKCWLYSSHLFSCAFQPCPPLIFNSSHPSLTLPFILLPFQSLTPAPPHVFSPSSSASHLLSSLAPSTPSVSLITSPLPSPSPPVYPYSQLVQYRSLGATVRQIGREGGSADTEGSTLRTAVHAAGCCSTPVCKFHRACEGKKR